MTGKRIPSPAAPLDLLRAELRRRDLTGFAVPRADRHQGEYVADSAQRLTWLTGFTGSAGVAMVLSERAAVFVDGRYTLQVRQQVDATRFELLHLTEMPPTDWLADALRAGDRLGIDPWLHTAEQRERLQTVCERAGARLVMCDGNPLDAVWADRPAPPSAPLHIHSEAWAGVSSAEKRANLAEALMADHLDAVVLADPASVAWLLNIRGGDVAYTPIALCFAIADAHGRVTLFVAPERISPELREHLGEGTAVLPPEDLPKALADLARGGTRVRVDDAHTPVAIVDHLGQHGATVDRGADPCALPKACKNAVELAGARAAHRRDGVALCRFLAWLSRRAPQGGLDELAVVDRLEEFRAEQDLHRGPSFPTIAGAAANGAIVHYHTTPETNRVMNRGDLFLLDSGAQYLDGTTDVTRTVLIGGEEAGEDAPADARRHFTLVLKGHIALARARFPQGTTGSQLDVLARLPLWRSGLDYDHGTGHGVGSYLSVHEGPARISKLGAGAVALRPGMVLSNEPGYYRTGAYGIRIENLVTVIEAPDAPGGERPLLTFETLTLAPIDRALIDPSLLDAGERDWINAYHARVLSEIGPLVDDQTRRWLEGATRPI